MFIQTEDTPNPLAMKFSPGRAFSIQQDKTYSKDDITVTDPLAQSLLSIMGVRKVYFGEDFVTVTRDETSEWLFLKPQILGAIMDYFMGDPTSYTIHEPQEAAPYDDSPIAQEIRDIIETRIKPAVAEHGGTITFDSFQDGIVYLNFQGACSSCPSSEMTLKMGVEKMLMHYIPEVTEVKAINR